MTVKSGTMSSNGYRRANELAAAREHAECLSEVLGILVRPLLCIHTAQLPDTHFVVDGIDVLAPAQLIGWLRSLLPALLDMEIIAVRTAARSKLDVRDVPAPVTDPEPHENTGTGGPRQSPPLRPGPPNGSLPPPERWRRSPPEPPSPRPSHARPKRSAKSRRREKLVVEALTSFAVLAVAAVWLPHAVQSTQRKYATPPTAVASATGPSQPPALQSGSFSCAGRGHGWTLTVPPAGSGTYQVQWSLAPDGPWTTTTWQPGSPLNVGGLPSGGRVFLRAEAAGAAADAPESMAMQKTPSQSC